MEEIEKLKEEVKFYKGENHRLYIDLEMRNADNKKLREHLSYLREIIQKTKDNFSLDLLSEALDKTKVWFL